MSMYRRPCRTSTSLRDIAGRRQLSRRGPNPVSSSDLRSLRIQSWPPPAPWLSPSPRTSDAVFGAPVTSCSTVRRAVAVELLDLVGDRGHRLGRRRRVHQHPPRGDEAMRGVDGDDLAVDDHVGAGVALGLGAGLELVVRHDAQRAAGTQVVVGVAGVPVAVRPLRVGQCGPDRVGGGLDVHA